MLSTHMHTSSGPLLFGLEWVYTILCKTSQVNHPRIPSTNRNLAKPTQEHHTGPRASMLPRGLPKHSGDHWLFTFNKHLHLYLQLTPSSTLAIRVGPQDHRTTGPQDHRTTGQQDHRTTGPQDNRTTGQQDHRTTGPQDPRTTRPQDNRTTDIFT